ncbi:TonB-dependent receptor [Sabulilitoribacter arenilitoris]|uniref:TonB-dependent receptor n=1 Tax=Wocania arenilitoris TaxID=2044858 RepID=A0AAE3EQA5_9FLAO|nr:outer membrane beta-barrel family protein [Wocania arenilitoris]MCF7568667.1 TonB-dependent receptor [Wocania arenilitoris]
MSLKSIHLLLFVFSISCFSQEYRVNGYVKDDKSNAIAYANVVITKNSKVTEGIAIGASTDENGYFIIENLITGNYTIKVSFLGYITYTETFELDKHTKLNNIVLKENIEALGGITVYAKKPTLKRLVDRLVFNVENSTLSNNNVLDVLKNTPGVLVHDGNITVKNSEPTVYINDRRVHLSSSEIQQLLEGTSATNIKSIEVITNPPAKYEAEGGAVLNIVTSKNIVAGYNGSVFGNFKQGSEYPKYAFGTSHFFKTKKLSAYINYNISPKRDFRNNTEAVNFIENNQNTSSWETDYKRTRETSNQNINSSINYHLNDKNNIGFSTNLLFSPRANTKNTVDSFTEVYNVSGVLDSTFTSLNRKVDETFNLAFTLDYLLKLKKEGEKLSASVHHTNYDFSSFQNVDTDYLFPDESLIRSNRFQTFSSQEIKIYTGQFDYELPINDSSEFEAGLKVSNINSESILDQFLFDNGIKLQDLENSDKFLYDETNYAAYSSYSKDWGKWHLKAGLRTEITNIKGNSLSTNQISNNDYIKLFPSFHLLNEINENNEIYFNYNKRIYRPRYDQLNPFKYFLNDNAFVTGNPKLRPQIDDVFTLGYTFNKDYTFELYYRYENNSTLLVIVQDNEENLIKNINTNLNRSISYGLDFTTYTKISNNWNLYALASAFKFEDQFNALESNNELIDNGRWSVYSQIINYFTFLKDKSLSADLAYLYVSDIASGPYVNSSRSSLDLNLRKLLWENRASLSIGIVDFFNNQNFSRSARYLNQDIFFKYGKETRLFTLGFNYKFGNYKLKAKKKEINSQERDRLQE